VKNTPTFGWILKNGIVLESSHQTLLIHAIGVIVEHGRLAVAVAGETLLFLYLHVRLDLLCCVRAHHHSPYVVHCLKENGNGVRAPHRLEFELNGHQEL
jgi:hypothetical protein